MLAFWKSIQDVSRNSEWAYPRTKVHGQCTSHVPPSLFTPVWRPPQHRPKVETHNSSCRSFTIWLTHFSQLSWINSSLADRRADSSVKHKVTNPLLYSLPSTLCLNAWPTHKGSAGSCNMQEKHVLNGGELCGSDGQFGTAICRGFWKIGKVQQDRQKWLVGLRKCPSARDLKTSIYLSH